MKILPVILSGGHGTRLWPLSQPHRPKQLLDLTGAGAMIALTALRVADPSLFAPPMLIAGADHAAAARDALQAAGVTPGTILIEPARRNTAAAIALAALAASPEQLLLVMPSDHLVAEPAALIVAVERAVRTAEEGWIVTFSVRPDRAETGYGYIARGAGLEEGVHRIARFVEKPDAATAQAYVAAGDMDWNAGIFLFRSSAMLAALDQHAPDIIGGVRASLEPDGLIDADRFAAVRAESIDKAVLEQTDCAAVVPVSMGWTDLGSWDSLYAVLPHDADGNAVAGTGVAIDSSGCLIRATTKPLVAIGMCDHILVETEEAILVLPRGLGHRVGEAISKHK